MISSLQTCPERTPTARPGSTGAEEAPPRPTEYVAAMPPRALSSVAAITLLLGCGSSGQTAAGGSTTTVATTGRGGAGGMGGAGGAAGSGGAAGAGGAVSCLSCDAPAATGSLADPALNEVSGVVASLAHPGVFWVHNDSGDSARFFAVDAAGQRLATITVANAGAVDWEDIARGPCPGGTCLYLADIGDNLLQRDVYTVYRVPEPAAVADGSVTAERLDFTYPDGHHNAETLLVHPVTGAITIITKVYIGTSSVFEFPLPLTPGAPVVLHDAGAVKPPSGSVLYTGGDVHPAGTGLLLRTYSEVWYYPLAPGATVAGALAGAPCKMPVASEPQGEAVGFLPDGNGYLTISEGAGAAVNRVSCPGL